MEVTGAYWAKKNRPHVAKICSNTIEVVVLDLRRGDAAGGM
jgi:hypothetical protein